MVQDNVCYDITIIGGGPAGLYAAFYSGMRDLKTKVIEHEKELGGKVNVYKEKTIWDVGGLPPTSGSQLISQLIKQALTFHPTIALGEQVVDIRRTDNGYFQMKTDQNRSHYSKAIILATGYGILQQTKLNIEGAEKFETSNLHYAVTDLEHFRQKHVVISGGGNSAVDWANELEPMAKSVTVVHRRHQFGGHEKFVTKMRHSSVDILTPYAIDDVKASPDGCCIEQVTLKHCESGYCQWRKADAVLIHHGYQPDLSFLDHHPLGLQVEERRLYTSHQMETAASGIFAAGDISNHPSSIPLIAGAFTEASLAVNAAKLYIHPDADRYARVSSHNNRFKQHN
ncbi:NAD(P)/FAD-dependent oxidoreductase [Salicibibacter cibarius]|uniref:Ferredoxin--NADP reductase n=1 Tax=Salicibibacter cibarius TaxID=2743000 RepID=A0A7T6Z7R6_9BACI|nr:NAD(P)/FAD-dependent oxidoreductase [Salicibibacter cibarius]QQK78237.1 NAD(P)/FAD-dependent oxidoreductase [Salicibibacter cibarius]